MIKLIATAVLASAISPLGFGADYMIDDAHTSVNFKVKHLGYSWVTGRFNSLSGNFSFDDGAIGDSSISVTIDTSSIDTNHAERDKHMRSGDFLDANKYPEATFVSTSVDADEDGNLAVTGKFTFRGVTKSIVIDAEKVGEGKDPWGGYRAGFTGSTEIQMSDFNMPMDFGVVMLELEVEGIRK